MSPNPPTNKHQTQQAISHQTIPIHNHALLSHPSPPRHPPLHRLRRDMPHPQRLSWQSSVLHLPTLRGPARRIRMRQSKRPMLQRRKRERQQRPQQMRHLQQPRSI
ncbi:hypothetical protein EJ04DRAFT_85000 [Polyplosphaeria fusca]|uniref:Uncharacterized protein n=1 Tax=Polyplosphaeria fusca TaxID=682080 RepID=A0A9P4QP01_9PLEO|nr:hypothetical protein EJ04DRAFT_85000 [Polyplosphaeria fusca]